MPALVDIFKYVAADLWKSGEYDAKVDNANSFVRRLEPPILSSAKAGAIVKLLAALDVLHGIPVPGSTDRASHLLVDTADYAIKLRTVNARLGAGREQLDRDRAAQGRSRTISSRVEAANAEDALSSIVSFATQYLTETTTRRRRPPRARAPEHAHDVRGRPRRRSPICRRSRRRSQACYIDQFQRDSRVVPDRPQLRDARPAREARASTRRTRRPSRTGSCRCCAAIRPADVEAYRPILQLAAATASRRCRGR